jgi:hypothetical protein
MKNGKQPAFAVSREMCEISEIETYPYGLTKREYFAGLAMQGWIACQSETFRGEADSVARRAVEYADALLAELEKTKQEEE